MNKVSTILHCIITRCGQLLASTDEGSVFNKAYDNGFVILRSFQMTLEAELPKQDIGAVIIPDKGVVLHTVTPS